MALRCILHCYAGCAQLSRLFLDTQVLDRNHLCVTLKLERDVACVRCRVCAAVTEGDESVLLVFV